MFRKSNKRRPGREEPRRGPAEPPGPAVPVRFAPGPHGALPPHQSDFAPSLQAGPMGRGPEAARFNGPPGDFDTAELAAVPDSPPPHAEPPGRAPTPPDEPEDVPSRDGPRLPPPPPVSRLRSAVVAFFTLVLSAGLLLGAQVDRPGFAVVCLGVQALFVAAATYGNQPPGPWVIALVGAGGAGAADALAVYSSEASLQPLGYVVVGGMLLGVVGQIARGAGRSRVTEALGATISTVVGTVGLATPILLTRHPGGREALAACLLATGVALVLARLADLVLPWPRVSPQVPRGAIGVVIGTMAGTGAAAGAGWLLMGVSTGVAAFGGLVVALMALLSDLGMGFAEASRRLAGEPVDGPRPWVRLALGPLVALAVAAPATYLLGVLLLDAA